MSQLTIPNYDIVISHKFCPDGSASSWCHKQYEKNTKLDTKYHEVHAGEYLDIDYKDKTVLLVDICFKKNELLEMAKVAKFITVLDHHKSSQDSIDIQADNVNIIFDMKRCGAQIAWDYFFPNVQRPWFIEIIADRDLWKWEMKESKEVGAYMNYKGMFHHDAYDRLTVITEKEKEQMYEQGKLIIEFREREIKTYVKNAILTTMKTKTSTYVVYLVECRRDYASDVGNLLAKDTKCDFVACYRYNVPTHEWYISCRAEKSNIDLSVITKEFNGGGHIKASGFQFSANIPLKDFFVPI
jgi:oligoribonuclease NrnB/cAMP/cGMP phosphodiesterase (DHH superfamily)